VRYRHEYVDIIRVDERGLRHITPKSIRPDPCRGRAKNRLQWGRIMELAIDSVPR
jgi:hypothetical protein